jgi:oligopeptide transport system ATP-binding protein
MRDLRGRDIAMIFQDPMTSLNPVLTIEEQMVETIRAHRRVSRKEARNRTLELLGMVGIPQPAKRLRDYPHQFSGGMRQRVMIAMALALEPKILIADEPTTALDVTIQAQVLDLLARLTAEHSTAVILITHDLGVVAGMTKRINVMYAGFVVESAPTADLFARPRHPYTVGLLHSIPRLDAQPGEPLIPIEGVPPDLRRAPTGCPFAPRCAWRLQQCWSAMPDLEAVDGAREVVTTGPGASHRVACWNPATAEEAAAAQPLRPGFVSAPPPGEAVA